MKEWFDKARSLFSQAVNGLIFMGDIDQTVSSRAYTDQHDSRIWALIRKAADQLFGADHCKLSFEDDEQYADQIREKRLDLSRRGIG